MISKHLERHLPTLKKLSGMKKVSARTALLKRLSDDVTVYKALREISKNIVKKNVPLTKIQKRKLIKHEKYILSLAKKGHKKKRRKVLVQQAGKGFFLPVIIPAVASIIAELIKNTNG